MWADIPEGAAVLDLGCGAGMDSVIAARRTGPAGTIVGLDFRAAIFPRAHTAAPHLTFVQANAEMLPLPDRSMMWLW